MSLETIADDLYGLTPAEFTHARNARAQAARAAGDKVLAGQIRALRKPTVAAWLANQVVRQHRDLVESLIRLGADLRAAMAAPSGPELRRLDAAHRDLVHALLKRAQEVASASGHPATEPVVQSLSVTFRAALSDPYAAEALASGRLTEALTPPVFAGMPQDSERADAPPTLGSSAKPSDTLADNDATARHDQARREVAEAQDRAQESRLLLNQARASLDRASKRTRLASDMVDQLRLELADATEQRDRAQQAEDGARTAFDQADHSLREVEEQLGLALSALDQPPSRELGHGLAGALADPPASVDRLGDSDHH